MQERIQIDRFNVENYRRIQKCDVQLAPITFFIGPNASGTTSFVDALPFIGSAIRDSLAKTIGARSAIHLIAQAHNPSSDFAVHLNLSSSNGNTCEFLLELLITDGWLVSVAREECRLQTVGGEAHYYVVEGGTRTRFSSRIPCSERRPHLSVECIWTPRIPSYLRFPNRNQIDRVHNALDS
jgi:predicted ATPase